MKQDRKWLKNQIEIMGTETSENYPHEQMVDREVVLKLVDQLDEPEKVVIPQFVADHIRFSKEEENSPRASMDEAHISKELNDWLAKTEDYMHYPNQEKFMQTWVYGCEVEKEPLYFISFPTPNSGHINMWRDTDTGSYYFSKSSNLISQDGYKCAFTEKEIKEHDDRYWPFAVPVEEE